MGNTESTAIQLRWNESNARHAGVVALSTNDLWKRKTYCYADRHTYSYACSVLGHLHAIAGRHWHQRAMGSLPVADLTDWELAEVRLKAHGLTFPGKSEMNSEKIMTEVGMGAAAGA